MDTFKQVASTPGLLVDIDWSSFFTSFFSSVKLKIAVKDRSRISHKRVMEFDKKLYVIKFKTEGQMPNPEESDPEDKLNEDDDADDLGPDVDRSSKEDTNMADKTPDKDGEKKYAGKGNGESSSSRNY